jgi:leucyl-tRNA synthetase
MKKRVSKSPRARGLRSAATESERLLWGVLRARQLCNLKFRRQHPIGPFYADFACVERRVVIEIDGGYHEVIVQSDLDREAYLKQCGWDVVRFTDEEVVQDVEAVARAIAKHLGLNFEFCKRNASGSGMENIHAPNKRKRRTREQA